MSFAKSLRTFLSQKFCLWDPKAQAFNNFYRDLGNSTLYQELSREIHGHPCLAYNLNSPAFYSELEGLIKEIGSEPHETFADIGCGLGVLGQLINEQHGGKVYGWDFSEVALSQAQELYPKHHYFLHHHNLGFPREHIECTRKFALDSLYSEPNARNSQNNFIHQVKKLLRPKTKTLLIIQNFNEHDFSPERLSLPGFSMSIKDYTEDFIVLVQSWTKALQTQDVHNDRKKFDLLWSTIEREFSHHQRSLNEKPLKRYRILYQEN